MVDLIEPQEGRKEGGNNGRKRKPRPSIDPFSQERKRTDEKTEA